MTLYALCAPVMISLAKRSGILSYLVYLLFIYITFSNYILLLTCFFNFFVYDILRTAGQCTTPSTFDETDLEAMDYMKSRLMVLGMSIA